MGRNFTLFGQDNKFRKAIVEQALTIVKKRVVQPRSAKIPRRVSPDIDPDDALRLLAAIVESSDDAIISIDLDMTITTWNKSAEHLFGYTADEVIGKCVALIIPQDRQQEEPQILARIRRGERIEHYETLRQRKDGALLNISLTVSPLLDAQGNIVGASKIARDITSRVRGDRRRLAQYAVASLLAGARTLDEASRLILPTIASIGDWIYAGIWLREENSEQLTCSAFWHAGSEKLEAFGKHTRGVRLAPGEGLPGRVWGSNEPVWVHDISIDPNFLRKQEAQQAELLGGFAFPLFADQHVNGVIEVYSDDFVDLDPDLLQFVTALGSQIGLFIEARRAEAALAQAKETAEAANAAKDKFLAMLSHELRTPLTPVLLSAEGLVSDPNIDADVRDGLKMICRNVELEARLVDDLLDLTRITRGKLQLQLGPVDVEELVRNAFEIVRNEMQDRHLHVEMSLQAEAHQTVGDGPRLQQVLWNLLRNAYKFSSLDGEIAIRTFNRENNIVVEITDKGLGIEPRYLAKIFEAFEQIGSERGGLGLGLAISKSIVEMHGGKIAGRSEGLGKGATFSVELPIR